MSNPLFSILGKIATLSRVLKRLQRPAVAKIEAPKIEAVAKIEKDKTVAAPSTGQNNPNGPINGASTEQDDGAPKPLPKEVSSVDRVSVSWASDTGIENTTSFQTVPMDPTFPFVSTSAYESSG